MNLKVLGHNVFIRPEKLPETTEDGLLHLVHDRSASTMRGTVVAVGEGPEFAKRAVEAVLDEIAEIVPETADRLRNELNFEHLVQVGDRVLFSPDKGEELIFEKDLLVCLREDDILAVVDQE